MAKQGQDVVSSHHARASVPQKQFISSRSQYLHPFKVAPAPPWEISGCPCHTLRLRHVSVAGVRVAVWRGGGGWRVRDGACV